MTNIEAIARAYATACEQIRAGDNQSASRTVVDMDRFVSDLQNNGEFHRATILRTELLKAASIVQANPYFTPEWT